MSSPDLSVSADQPSESRNRLVLVVYTAAIFVSALLLFSVQPLFTKMVLPRLGGSPAVWSVAMVFFQSLLLGGYAYAHFLMQVRNRTVPVAAHLLLLACAMLTLPLSISSGWGDPPTSGYAPWLLGLFAVSIGLPFFALAANNPLLQAWFVRTGHPNGPDPYFLYASSNIGSFLALLSYPVLLEPMCTLRTQNLIWTGGYGLLILLIASCGVLLLRSPANAAAINMPEDDTDAPAPSWILRARWIFLAAVPSGLLIAVTAHISTDVAAAPLLWVLPLSLYLLTWVLVFQSRPLLPHKWMLLAQPLAIAGVVILLAVGGEQNLLLTLGGHQLCFFVIAIACHGELARTRPAAKYLTGFYVALSFGGMVGGLFAGLIAPFTFSWVAEYPILLALAIPFWTRLAKGKRRPLVIIALGTIAISFAFSAGHIVREARWLTPAQFEQMLSSIPGSPSVYQWLPVWVHDPLPKMTAAVEAGDRQLTIKSWEPEKRIFQVSAGAATDARVQTFFYPHWQANAEGRALAIHPDQNGAMVIALPKEAATVTLEFHEPKRVTYAAGLTLVGWALIGGLLIKRRTRTSVPLSD